MLDRFFHSFDHNSLVSRSFSTRKVSDRSSQRAPRIGQGMVCSIQLLVRSTVWSNLGQTWSNLVKALQTLGNGSRTTFWGFQGTVDPSRVGNGSVKPRSNIGQPWSNLVNPSQTWLNLGKCVWTFFLGVFDVARCRRITLARSGLSRLVRQHPRKSRG